jgi:hypothetical protein
MLKRTDKFVCSALLLVSVMPVAMSQTDPARTAIPVQRVADAMASAGISVNPDQIEILSGSDPTDEGANVRLVSVTHGSAGKAKVKLRCQNNHECLPFYVLVDGIQRADRDPLKARLEPVIMPTILPKIIRAGDHATLILETGDARMSFPVICLQSGVRGQRIRAASPDRKQLYHAEVVAAGMLRGNF